jgi:hypothetical protein
MGYTVVLHIDLYKIFPALVILPLALIAVVVHFAMQSRSASAKAELSKMLHGEQKAVHKLSAVVPIQDETPSTRTRRRQDESLHSKGALNTPLEPVHTHISRRASAVQGLKMLSKLQRRQVQPEYIAEQQASYSSEQDGSYSDESGGSDSESDNGSDNRSSTKGDREGGEEEQDSISEESKSDGSEEPAEAVRGVRGEDAIRAAHRTVEDEEVDAFFEQLDLDSDEE